MESPDAPPAKPSSCETSNQPVELESSTVVLSPSGSNVISPVEPPTGLPCGNTGIKRLKNLGPQPDMNVGLVLFKARMVLEDRYQELKALVKRLYNEAGEKKHFGKADHQAARQMGYVGCEDEINRATMLKAPSPHWEKPSTKVDAKADLEEAYRKFEISGLTKDDFIRPEAWFWYQQYHDEELRKDVVKLVAANLVAPSAKGQVKDDGAGGSGREESASQMSELERFIRERKGDS